LIWFMAAGRKTWKAVTAAQIAANSGRSGIALIKLRGADLRGTNLSQAKLSGVHLEGANLFKAVLDGADLTGAFLYGAQFLNCAQLVVARNWESAFRDEELACGAAIPEARLAR
jgi:uncharacterized protein YjbI with pentapeptide repeats